MAHWLKPGKAMEPILLSLLGFTGADPVTFDVNAIDPTIEAIKKEQLLLLPGKANRF